MRIKRNRFTFQHFNQAKTIWDEFKKLDEKIYVRINFNGESLVDRWAQKCVSYISKIPNVELLELVTNNSLNPEKYLHMISLEKTSFNCSFHPEFITLHGFIKNILILKKKGFQVVANILSIPEIIKKVPQIYSIFKKNKITLRLQAFRTIGFKYMGRRYPEDYNTKEIKILKEFYSTKEEFEYLVENKPTKGLNCLAGVDMINVFLDGTVRRCFSGSIGETSQIKDGKVEFLAKKIYSGIQKIMKLTNLRKIDKFYSKYTNRDQNVFDLIEGKIKLKEKPYPCHEENCFCTAHLVNLENFRKKHLFSDKFIDTYIN